MALNMLTVDGSAAIQNGFHPALSEARHDLGR